MTDTNRLLDIRVIDTPERAYAGEWIPVTLLLQRPDDGGPSLRIRDVGCPDKDVQLDCDLLQSDLELRPGESYQLTIPLKVPHPRSFSLNKILIQVVPTAPAQALPFSVALPHRPLAIVPAIGREIGVTVEPLCTYEAGTKALLIFQHRGATEFRNVTITLGPEQVIRAGKCLLRRASFAPGDSEQMEVVAGTGHLDIHLTGQADDVPTEARLSLPVGRVPSRTERQRFRFLEPRRLSMDQRTVYEVHGTEQRRIEPIHAAYPIQSGQRYLIVITPQDREVQEVHLRNVEGVLQVRTAERTEDNRSWRFLVDVAGHSMFRKPERIFYDVRRAEETLRGEIHLTLLPYWGRHFRLAIALGVAVTLQGFTALFKFVAKAEYTFEEAVSHFHITSDYQLLFPLCIPLLWAGIALFDRIQYKFQNE